MTTTHFELYSKHSTNFRAIIKIERIPRGALEETFKLQLETRKFRSSIICINKSRHNNAQKKKQIKHRINARNSNIKKDSQEVHVLLLLCDRIESCLVVLTRTCGAFANRLAKSIDLLKSVTLSCQVVQIRLMNS